MKNNDFNDFLKSVQQMGEKMKGRRLAGTKVTYRAIPEKKEGKKIEAAIKKTIKVASGLQWKKS